MDDVYKSTTRGLAVTAQFMVYENPNIWSSTTLELTINQQCLTRVLGLAATAQLKNQESSRQFPLASHQRRFPGGLNQVTRLGAGFFVHHETS